MATEQVLHIHMKGGEGETSYSTNSLVQKKVILKVKPILEESIKRMLSSTTFESGLNVADLGCSTGPNALLVVYNIIKIIDSTNQNLSRDPFEVKFYLNDLFGNDFNSIFKSLPDFYQRIDQEEVKDKVFINATPGNFYGRLFPNNYIHLFHSSYSLHWLSQAPKSLTKRSEPLNKGNICLTPTSPLIVYRAYFEQFQKDFKLFLKSRAEELMLGGTMIVTMMGRENTHDIGNPSMVISMVLNDMALEGLIDEVTLDFFDLPLYSPTTEEVRQVIDEERSFTLQTLNTSKIGWDGNIQDDVDDCVFDRNMRGEFMAKSIRAVLEPLLETVFGKDIMDELFSRFAKKVAQLLEYETLELTNLVVCMRKNP
ncbi:hypothetical protein RIF29_26105 [Crotalaria pallida]|uniref:Uncharacterized protein n=1 Tax=Crotalaria pallida TaxID=3830 RepID=A0AAN9I1I1_CROPI